MKASRGLRHICTACLRLLHDVWAESSHALALHQTACVPNRHDLPLPTTYKGQRCRLHARPTALTR